MAFLARTIGSAIVASGALVLAAAPAHAQLCHPVADGDPDGDDLDDDGDAAPMPDMADMPGMTADEMAAMHHARPRAQPSLDTVTARAGAEVDVATIAMGSYGGFVPSVDVAWWRLEARVAAPVYHLEYRGVKSDGPGDVLLSLAATGVQGRHLRAGVALAATEPTGNERLGLGMGDTMWMPGAWASWSAGRWGVTAQGSYGWMATTTAAGGAHHHGPGYVGSLVSPMNHEEIAGAVRGTYRATRALRVHALASTSVPVGMDGTTYAYAATGARYALGAWETGVEAALPIAGDPFHARLAFDVARAF